MPAKKGKKSRLKSRVVKVSTEQPEARDEGPRLIPQRESVRDVVPSGVQHYIDLADVALGLKKSKPKP